MSAQPLPTPGYPAVGALINGKYQVEKIIGEGGVGVVVAAVNVELGDRVALKFLRPEMLERADVVGRFMFEAKAASTIKCDHSATVFDVGRTADGVPFLVMEFLEGQDLASVIEQQGRLEVRDVAEFAMHACEALAAAHAKGIVHRDIKPENLFIEQRSGMKSIKVLDFGISKIALTGDAVASITSVVETQNLMGTPLYMSPEQIRAPEQVDARTDIYSLGVVMYEALTGTLPILSESITELCAAILEQPPTPITQHRPDLPPELVEVIDKCLAKEQKDRFQNAAEVAIALLPFAPKRARICAERAGEILVLAGLAAPESVRFASEIPSSLASGHPSVRIPPHSKITPIGLHTPATSISVVPSHGAVSLPSGAPAAPPKDRKKLIIAVAAIVVGIAGAAFALTNRGAPPAATPPPPADTVAKTEPETKPAAPEPAPEPKPTVQEPVQDAHSAPTTPPPPKSVAPVRPAPAAPPPVARPAAKVPSATPSTTKPDALDIGY